MDLLYFIGAPGSGKSTLMKYLVRDLVMLERSYRAKYDLTKGPGERDTFWLEYYPPAIGEAMAKDSRTLFPPGVVELGRESSASGGRGRGTDRYDKCIHQWIYTWWRIFLFPKVLGEGDRLGYPGFLTEARALGYSVELVYLDVPDDECERRRQARGTEQNPSWVKGRVTKARNLAEAEGARLLDATQPLWGQEWDLRHNPVVRTLRQMRRATLVPGV